MRRPASLPEQYIPVKSVKYTYDVEKDDGTMVL